MPRPVLPLVLLALLLPACRSRAAEPEPPPDRAPAGEGDRDWYAGTPKMQAEIRRLIDQIPTSEGAARIEIGRKLMAFGEPAVPQLVRALSHPSTDTRGTAAWLLGMLGDPRVVPPLERAMGDPDQLVRYEAATALLRLGDRKGLDTIIGGLESPDVTIRAKCILVLRDVTGSAFGFEPDDPPLDREAAVARWKAWARREGPR
jgi:hypothetical protein